MHDGLEEDFVMRRVISPSLGPIFGCKRIHGEKFLSPKKASKQANPQSSIDEVFFATSLKEVLLAKVSSTELEVVYGFDEPQRRNQESDGKRDFCFKKKINMIQRLRICEIDKSHGEIVDAQGYFVETNGQEELDFYPGFETDRQISQG